MTESELHIQTLENQFPMLSGIAFGDARKTVIAHGLTVCDSDCGALYRVFPDGGREKIRDIAPAVHVRTGQKVRID